MAAAMKAIGQLAARPSGQREDESEGLGRMKYAIIIPDGCADEPQESLGRQDAASGGQHARHGRRGGGRRRRASQQHAGSLPPAPTWPT